MVTNAKWAAKDTSAGFMQHNISTHNDAHFFAAAIQSCGTAAILNLLTISILIFSITRFINPAFGTFEV
jgi:hypothetical protein